MLIEIQCDKFMDNGTPRPPIKLHAGLNTVLGDREASNSIGKTTFLYIIDFAFGGNDYLTSDAIEEVGAHTINFVFEFELDEKKKIRHYFSRNTETRTSVSVCDENYSPIGEPITLDAFKKKLLTLYGIDRKGLTFRDVIGRYFRLFGKKNDDVENPLLADAKEKVEKAIPIIMHLFGASDAFIAIQSKLKETEERKTALSAAGEFGYVATGFKNKTEEKEVTALIEALRNELAELIARTDQNISKMNSEQADAGSDAKGRLMQARRQRGRLRSQLNVIERNLSDITFTAEGDFGTLSKFFPTADIKSLAQIEGFHRNISQILTYEYEEERQQLLLLIQSAEQEISAIEAEMRSLGVSQNLSKNFIDKLSELTRRIAGLEKRRESHENIQTLKIEKKDYEKQLTAAQQDDMNSISEKINAQLKSLSSAIEATAFPPTFTLQSSKKYTFVTPKDKGTGASYKGLILFDLSVLELTQLPAISHDSHILKNIGDVPIERIMELYLQKTKQVFIALDKDSAYSERACQILNDTAVLRLSNHEGALFGWRWNEKK